MLLKMALKSPLLLLWPLLFLGNYTSLKHLHLVTLIWHRPTLSIFQYFTICTFQCINRTHRCCFQSLQPFNKHNLSTLPLLVPLLPAFLDLPINLRSCTVFRLNLVCLFQVRKANQCEFADANFCQIWTWNRCNVEDYQSLLLEYPIPLPRLLVSSHLWHFQPFLWVSFPTFSNFLANSWTLNPGTCGKLSSHWPTLPFSSLVSRKFFIRSDDNFWTTLPLSTP